jgi:hypothetical protein
VDAVKGTCRLCGQPVEDIHTAAYRVTGWEVERSGGGANQIADRRRVPDVVVHAVCLRALQKRRELGVGDRQLSFL